MGLVPVANLADLLENASANRMQNLPQGNPIMAPPAPPPPVITPDLEDKGMGALLPALLGMQNGMQGQGGSGPVGSSGGTPSHWENVAQRIATNKYNYSPQDFNKLDYIIGNESSWDPHALNDSGAAGIAQNISGFSGGYSENDPKEQIRWLLNYVDSHPYQGYGTGIDAAYQHKQDTGWY